MDPEVRREYDAALGAAALRNGTLVAAHPTAYGWRAEWDEQEHASACGLLSDAAPEETEWSEFTDSYAPNREFHGVSLAGVGCRCGRLAGREVRWEATVSEVAEALFEEAFRQIAQLRGERKSES